MHVEKKKKKLPKLAILNRQLQNLLTFCLQLGVSEWIFVLKSLQWLASVTSLCAQCAFLDKIMYFAKIYFSQSDICNMIIDPVIEICMHSTLKNCQKIIYNYIFLLSFCHLMLHPCIVQW